jgi:hypothetical protein
MKKLYIFIDDNKAQTSEITNEFEEYINENFSDYVLLLTEKREPIMDEAGTVYLISEY